MKNPSITSERQKEAGDKLLDENIVDLYWERSEDAISETSKKYGKYCFSIAYNILRNSEDSDECVNDTYMNAWNSMPTSRPKKLSSFLGKITRNLALNRYEFYTAKKRGDGQIEVALDELGECVSGSESAEAVIDRLIYDDLLNTFLGELTEENRKIFVSRYWYLRSPSEIAKKYRISESNVNVRLYRMRGSLRELLKKEGVY